MTTMPAPRPSTEPYESLSDAELWEGAFNFNYDGKMHVLRMTNFLGRNFPSVHPGLMVRLLNIKPGERVLDIGGGDSPFDRADVVTDAFPEDGAHRSGRSLSVQGNRRFVECFAESLPFEDKEFDFAYSRAVFEHVVDPAAACREMMRVAKRGFIETPTPLAEYLGGHPTHRWLIWVENSAEGVPTLVFHRKPFRRALFRYALRGKWFTDSDMRFRWEWQYRNVMNTQFTWEGEFAFRVEEDPEGIDYDDPRQAAEAHLDAAFQSLRFGEVPSNIILPDAEIAVKLCPDWATAWNTLGCTLWTERRYAEAVQAFQKAAILDPHCATYLHNTRQRPGDPNARLQLEPMTPEREDREDIATNFAGKVYYAFVNYDDRLAQDMNIKPGERVLDVGGGQRPLKRADVSIDFDVFEGLHRQGQTISREKPLVCGDVQNLPFASKSFDVACCRMVLEHVLDPAAACRELQRVAKRGFLETPNTFWECFYGHPTHRWLIEWEASTRTIVFRRKPFDSIPFKSAIVPYLYTQRDIQRNFEVAFRNVTTVQVSWDEENPFHVRVEDDPNAPYDYLMRPEDATRGSMNYARDLLNGGLPSVAIAEAEDALRHAPTPELKTEAIKLRLEIAMAMGDTAKSAEMRGLLRQGTSGQPQIRTSAPPEQAIVREVTNEGASLCWNAPLRDPSGYADEARHFLFALESIGYPVAAREIKWSEKIATLTPERERTLLRTLTRSAAPNAVHISHILAPHFQRNPKARLSIGRTMFETDRLPPGWADACNQMDRVWVPGEFNRQTFAGAGVAPEKLRIVPGAIDLRPYDPNCPALQINGARGYNFLSLFDWTLRKGWDVMIRAFVEEFRQEEDVALIIKTHSSLGYTGQTIMDMVGNYLINTLGLDPNRIPDVIIQDGNIPDERMPNLYRAANCYVMPSRGEGWGRPFMEAMAMGLPVIGTNWSGQTAFMTAENSLLLDYEVVDVPEAGWRETPTYTGHKWAEPSLPHLRQLMRQMFEDREKGREIGQKARAHLQKHFSYPVVASIIAKELESAN